MKNQDLEFAKLKLLDEKLSLVIVKDSLVLFETNEQGVSGFLQAIEMLDSHLNGSSVADKIVGLAAAMLCVYAGVSSVFALTISDGGIEALKNNNITCTFRNKVSNILNRKKTDVCPFENLASNSKTPDEAYRKLKSFNDQIKSNSTKANC